jgi:formyltetrahydrofolate deformylase
MKSVTESSRYILTFSCPDVAGIQAAVATFLFDAGAFLEEVASYGDPDTKAFFSRIVFSAAPSRAIEHDAVKAGFKPIAERFAMTWRIDDADRKCRTVIAVSREGHCLNDLLHRWSSGTLPVEIVGVVSNHDNLRGIVEWHRLPFHHLPTTRETRLQQENAFMSVVVAANADLVVLARYMHVLSHGMVARLAGRCINIHHSFLPGFKGAKPYHQAHVRGVKIIGATAHYVTDDLDEGPIIEQAVERVDHTATASDLVNVGRDIENTVLARAVRWHADRRVLLNGRRTIVFK